MATAVQPVLDVKNLNVTYRNKHKSVYAVVGCNLTINQGDSMGIVGESGSGKSTLATAILRLFGKGVADVTGDVDFMGKKLFELTEAQLNEIRWKNLAVVFQKSMNAFSPVHRVSTQIEDIYKTHEPNATKEEIFQKAMRMMQLVNLNDRAYRLYPHEMSGGMIQRISIAVSLLHEPNLIILDEATTALDVVTQGQILNELKKMESELNTSRIIITHDMSVVAASCNKISVMYAGYIVESGLVDDVFNRTAHPYTVGLIRSFPPLKGERTTLKSIPGFLPDLSVKHEGCIFAPRCEKAMDICHRESPATRDLGNDHRVACHLHGGGN